MRDARSMIFVVEDDLKSSLAIRGLLESADFRVHHFSNAYEVLPIARKMPPALFLIDVSLPGKSGIELCREIRKSPELYCVPVIFHSGKASESDRLAGLELGDEYISKPSSPRELLARVKAVLRRFERNARALSVRFGDLEVNRDGMLVKLNGESVEMTTSEFRLLCYFLQHPKRVFTREELLEALWDNEAYVSPRSVDACVKRLRKKIEPSTASPQYLQTIRGAGYRFVLHPLADENRDAYAAG
jgi:two-component system, OmpR family, phosphate regulon response regulator PhoB